MHARHSTHTVESSRDRVGVVYPARPGCLLGCGTLHSSTCNATLGASVQVCLMLAGLSPVAELWSTAELQSVAELWSLDAACSERRPQGSICAAELALLAASDLSMLQKQGQCAKHRQMQAGSAC